MRRSGCRGSARGSNYLVIKSILITASVILYHHKRQLVVLQDGLVHHEIEREEKQHVYQQGIGHAQVADNGEERVEITLGPGLCWATPPEPPVQE